MNDASDGMPECLLVLDEGEGYPPEFYCQKWDLVIESCEICEKCKGHFNKEQIFNEDLKFISKSRCAGSRRNGASK